MKFVYHVESNTSPFRLHTCNVRQEMLLSFAVCMSIFQRATRAAKENILQCRTPDLSVLLRKARFDFLRHLTTFPIGNIESILDRLHRPVALIQQCTHRI